MMYKKVLYRCYIMIIGLFLYIIVWNVLVSAQSIPWFDDVSIYHGDPDTIWIDTILNTEDLDDPLKAWAKDLWPNSIDGISDDDNADREWSKNNLLEMIQRVVNYVLWFLALISLILIIYNGFVLLLSPKDENVKKAREVIIKILWAIWGIWFSWLIVSSIFWIIWRFTEW